LFLAFAASTLAFASAAAAQTAPVGGPKPVSRADFIKRIDAGFAAVDTNHDGVWSKAEVDSAQAHTVQQRLQAEFKQLDTNHDGQLSMQEFAAGAPTLKVDGTPEQILQRLDTNHDGKVSADEFRAPQLAGFAKVDANHDGVVTPAEAKAATARK
jgi:hypothetical protein